jgi:hypothetical protein
MIDLSERKIILNTILKISAFLCLLISFSYATIINILSDIDYIHDGINLANPGDTVLVKSGTYIENINFNGKNRLLDHLYLLRYTDLTIQW